MSWRSVRCWPGAAAAGRVNPGQLRAINSVLGGLAAQLDSAQQARAEEVLVGLAATLDSDALSKAVPLVLAQVAPVDAEELLETRLQREAEEAQRARSFRFFRQGASVRFEGSLPRLEGEQFRSWHAITITVCWSRPSTASVTSGRCGSGQTTYPRSLRRAATPKPGSGCGTPAFRHSSEESLDPTGPQCRPVAKLARKCEGRWLRSG